MIEILFIFLIAITLFHFVYENFVVTYLYEKFLYDLFALRDKAFLMRCDSDKNEDIKVIDTVIASISGLIYVLKDLTLATLVRYNHQDESVALVKKEAERNIKLISASHLEEVKEIHELSMKIAMKAIAVNSGGLLIYLIPLFIGALVYKRIERAVKSISVLGEGRLKKTNTFGELTASELVASPA